MSVALVTGGGTRIGTAVAWLLGHRARARAPGNSPIDHAIDYSMTFLLI